MYLIEVEFFSWYEIPDDINAEYVNGNHAIFRIDDHIKLTLFVCELTAKEEVKRIITYKYL